MYLHNEMMSQMVAYHQERLEASMRAARNDRVVILKFRARVGSLLIAIGEGLGGDGVCDLIASSSPLVVSSSLRMRPQGEGA